MEWSKEIPTEDGDYLVYHTSRGTLDLITISSDKRVNHHFGEYDCYLSTSYKDFVECYHSDNFLYSEKIELPKENEDVK